jgi:hypothetical protein
LGSLKLSSKVGSVREREAEVSSQECCEDKLLGLKYQRNNSTFIYTLIHSPCLVKLMFKGGRDNTNPLSPPDSPVTGTVLIPILWTEKLRPTVVKGLSQGGSGSPRMKTHAAWLSLDTTCALSVTRKTREWLKRTRIRLNVHW